MNARQRAVADRLVGEVVKRRDQWTCQNPDCGRTHHTATIDAAHIVTKAAAPWIRYDIANIVSLCRTCHEWFGGHPDAWRVFIARKYPGRLQLLADRARAGERSGCSLDLSAIIADAREKLAA